MGHTRVRPAPSGAFQVEAQRRGPRVPNMGTSHDYRPDPWVVRRMREIDPRLSLEWRPGGRWWTSWTMPRPFGELPGCWRLLLRGKSGQYKGMMLLPPRWATSAHQGELIAYLEAHWLPRLADERRYAAGLECFNDDLMERRQQQARDAAWAKIDHGDAWRIARRLRAQMFGAGESGKVSWPGADLR